MRKLLLYLVCSICGLSMHGQPSAIHKECQKEISEEAKSNCTKEIFGMYIHEKIKQNVELKDNYEANISIEVSKTGLIKYYSSFSKPNLKNQIKNCINDLSYKIKLLPSKEDSVNTVSYLNFRIQFVENKISILDYLPANIGFDLASIQHFNSSNHESAEILKVVTTMPLFPGCELSHSHLEERRKCSKKLMLNFLYDNMEYPDSLLNGTIEGMSVVQFVVNENGVLSDFRIVRELCAECSVNTFNVLKSMPLWIPAENKHGKKVKVLYTLPVKFKI